MIILKFSLLKDGYCLKPLICKVWLKNVRPDSFHFISSMYEVYRSVSKGIFYWVAVAWQWSFSFRNRGNRESRRRNSIYFSVCSLARQREVGHSSLDIFEYVDRKNREHLYQYIWPCHLPLQVFIRRKRRFSPTTQNNIVGVFSHAIVVTLGWWIGSGFFVTLYFL